MTAPFSSPRFVGERLGRPGSRLARENIGVLSQIAYNASVGVQQTSRKAGRCAWGFCHLGRQTESERIPNPAKSHVRKISANFSPLAYFTTTQMLCRKFPAVRCFLETFDHACMDEVSALPVARKQSEIHFWDRTVVECSVLERDNLAGLKASHTSEINSALQSASSS
jgi:hypothetical protein